MFLLLGPPDHAAEHLDSLAAIARMMSDAEFRYEAGEAESEQESSRRRWNGSSSVRGHHPKNTTPRFSDSLHFSGKLCGGLDRRCALADCRTIGKIVAMD